MTINRSICENLNCSSAGEGNLSIQTVLAFWSFYFWAGVSGHLPIDIRALVVPGRSSLDWWLPMRKDGGGLPFALS
jgi:hypothetical protein